MTTSRTGFSTVNESAGCTHAIVLPGGGYQVRAAHEGQPIVTETYRLVTALTQAGVPHTTHVFAHGPHGLGLATGAGDAEQWTTLAERWLHRLALHCAPTNR